MRRTYLILFFLLLISSSYAFAVQEIELTYANNKISGTKSLNGKVEKFSLPANERNGLILVTPRAIAQAFGDDRFSAHPFSYADPTLTSMKVSVPHTHFVFSSFLEAKGKLIPRSVSQFVVGIARKDVWEKSRFSHLATNFVLIGPKKGAHIPKKHWEQSVKKIWKEFVDRFGRASDHIVIIDLVGPISGGPLGENVLGIFATDSMNKDFQADIEANLGWKPQATTKAYIHANYPKSDDPWGEYLLGTYAHEIGHLYFGFGITRERVASANELWFSLGMGMIYDMEVTKKLTGNLPALETAIIENWKNKYAKIPDIDQRLIKPDTTNDKKYSFDRKKVFAHGKATYFLSELRNNIGPDNFDEAMQKYLKECRECTAGYSDFKKFLKPYSKQIQALEKVYRL